MKRSVAIAIGLLLAAGLASAAPGTPRRASARRPGLLSWLFGRRHVAAVFHAPRPNVQRHRLEGRHDKGQHRGWYIGRHLGWNRQGKRNRDESRRGPNRPDNERRRGGGRGRN